MQEPNAATRQLGEELMGTFSESTAGFGFYAHMDQAKIEQLLSDETNNTANATVNDASTGICGATTSDNSYWGATTSLTSVFIALLMGALPSSTCAFGHLLCCCMIINLLGRVAHLAAYTRPDVCSKVKQVVAYAAYTDPSTVVMQIRRSNVGTIVCAAINTVALFTFIVVLALYNELTAYPLTAYVFYIWTIGAHMVLVKTIYRSLLVYTHARQHIQVNNIDAAAQFAHAERAADLATEIQRVSLETQKAKLDMYGNAIRIKRRRYIPKYTFNPKYKLAPGWTINSRGKARFPAHVEPAGPPSSDPNEFTAPEQLLTRRHSTAFASATISPQIVLATDRFTKHRLLVDTGCSISIIRNREFLVNIRNIEPINVQGVAGDRLVHEAGDLHIQAADNAGVYRTIVINNVLLDPESPANLLSGDQLRESGFAIRIDPDPSSCCMILNPHSDEPVYFPLRCENKIFSLYTPTERVFTACDATTVTNAMSFLAGNISLEELMHLRMNHANKEKLIEQSKRVDGVGRVLKRAPHLQGPCHTCQDAKATRNNYPPAVETWADGPDRWNMDMFDMGPDFTTIHENRYATMIVIQKSRFAMLFLHKDKSASTVKDILEKAFAKAGVRPRILRSDGAGEYEDEALGQWLQMLGIDHQWSVPDSQYQNALAEKFLDTLGAGIRTVLLQSNLNIEFWGLAALYIVDTYNMLPHSSIDNKIPYQEHTGSKADVSWCRPFGCRATVFRGADHVEHHKISPRGEAWIFVGLGTSQGKKAWLVYCPHLNRIFTSRDCQFDECFFPLRAHDQRVYGKYDYNTVQEMRASKHLVTLDQQPSKLTASDLWDPVVGEQILQHHFDLPIEVVDTDGAVITEEESIPVPISTGDLIGPRTRSKSTGALSNTSTATPSSSTGARAQTSTSSNSTGVRNSTSAATASPPPVPSLSGSTSTSVHRPGKRRSVTGGRIADKRRKCVTFNNDDVDEDWDWEACADKLLTDISDHDLAEYLVGTAIQVAMPAYYWPDDGGKWTVECIDTKVIDGVTHLVCSMTEGPIEDEKGKTTDIPVSRVGRQPDYSMRRALKINYPNATTPKMVFETQAHYARVYGAFTSSKPFTTPTRDTKWKPTTINKQSLAVSAFFALQALTWGAMKAIVGSDHSPLTRHVAPLPAQPKSQRDARSRPDWERWVTAEQVEMTVCYEKGTFEIVDLPAGVSELPSMFQYKLKLGPNGQFVKCKARLCARGDLQFEHEYGETFAPTSRFSMIRLLIAIATQANMTLFQFDIRGAFLCAEMDRDIYLKLPPGYEPGPGKTALLRRSLYGLRQSPMAFHSLIEKWMLNYGFVPIGKDRVTFMLNRGTSTVLLSLYVDDGICATNDAVLYRKFLADLSKDFELSDQGAIEWYLGVRIEQDVANRRTKLTQTQYIRDVLERFGMTGATPTSTPLEPNTHLTVADCPPPNQSNKEFKREYQRIIGALMYLANLTRPDIAHAVNQCSKFMSNPGPSHMAAARRILRYLAGTTELGITYEAQVASRAHLLWGFADADHAGDPDTRRSVTGYVLMMAGAAYPGNQLDKQ